MQELVSMQEDKVRFAHRFATAHPFLLLYARGQSSFCTQVCYCTSVFAAVCKRTKFVLHTGLLRTSVFAACRSTQTSEVTSIVVSHGMLRRTSVQNVQQEETNQVRAPAGLWTRVIVKPAIEKNDRYLYPRAQLALLTRLPASRSQVGRSRQSILRVCTPGGVDVPCIYTQAGRELPEATQVFVAVLVLSISSAD